MEVTVDQVGRIVLPKSIRDELGLVAGSTVDVSLYGDGVHLSPHGRVARLVEIDGKLKSTSDTEVTDDDVFRLADSVRR